MPATDAPPGVSTPPALSAVELEVIDMFVHVAQMLSLPKSIGEIYGLLFITPVPVPMDHVIGRLRISAGAASQGLKLLRSLRAVKTSYVLGDRRDHYVAEIELRKLTSGFLKEAIYPGLERGRERMVRLRTLSSDPSSPTSLRAGEDYEPEADLGPPIFDPRSPASAPPSAHLRERIRKLDHWHELACGMLPLLHTAVEEGGGEEERGGSRAPRAT